MRSRARNREEDAVVAVVVLEAAGLAQPEAVAVEGDDLREAVRVAGDADLHQPVTAIPPQSSGATSSRVSENVHR